MYEFISSGNKYIYLFRLIKNAQSSSSKLQQNLIQHNLQCLKYEFETNCNN